MQIQNNHANAAQNISQSNGLINSDYINDIEEKFIGMLIENNNFLEDIEHIIPEMFMNQILGQVLRTIREIHARSERSATPRTLKAYFIHDPYFAKNNIDPESFFIGLQTKSVYSHDFKEIANVVFEGYMYRQLIQLAQDSMSIVRGANQLERTSQSIIEEIERKLFALAQNLYLDSAAQDIRDVANEGLKKLMDLKEKGGDCTGVKCGFYDLDYKTGGFSQSDLVIIAARPSMGKTSLAVNMAVNMAKTTPVLFFSLEMSSEQLCNRIIAAETGIDAQKIFRGKMGSDDFIKIVSFTQKIQDDVLQFYIDDTAALTISEIRRRARRMKRKHDIGVVFIDYLQLVRASSNASKYNNRVHEIGEISQGLKALAKELKVPVIALSQLSRNVEHRENKKPQLSDLRDSGNIEQDADIVMFIYRVENEEGEKDSENNNLQESIAYANLNGVSYGGGMKGSAIDLIETQLIIAKHRNGPTGAIDLLFNGALTKFENRGV